MVEMGNSPPTILLIPTRNNGVMGCWGMGRYCMDAWMHECMNVRRFFLCMLHGFESNAKMWFIAAAAGVYLPMLHKGAIPSFQYSNIPSFPL
jgi:hypothetical protein